MSGAPEVLDVGTRSPTSRRRRLIALGVLLVVAVGALLLDARYRSAEADAVSGCRERAASALRLAAGPLWADAALVRPALARAGDDVRRDLYALLSKRAADAGRRLSAVRPACDVRVLWYHDELRRQRDACVGELDALRRWYAAVAADGRATFGPHPATGGCG